MNVTIFFIEEVMIKKSILIRIKLTMIIIN